MKITDVPADGEKTLSVKSVWHCTIKKRQSIDINDTVLYVRHHGVHLTERTSNIGWRAFMMDPTRLCRHDIPSLRTTASAHLHSLPLTTLNSNFRHAALTLHFHSNPCASYNIGATPIKVPFDHHTICIILKRSAFWHWNYIRNHNYGIYRPVFCLSCFEVLQPLLFIKDCRKLLASS